MSNHPIKYIEGYVHEHRIGVLVEFGMSIDFTAKVPEVAEFMKNVALQVAACDPKDIDDLLSQEFIKAPDKQVNDLFFLYKSLQASV